MTTNILQNFKQEVATELHSFFKEKCLNKKTRCYSLPFTFRSRMLGKELFKRMNPENKNDLKSARVDLHKETINSINCYSGRIFYECEVKRQSGQSGLYLIDDAVISKLKQYIKNNS